MDILIFVTVGTQDVPFDRLLKAVDKLVRNGVIKDEVVVQSGCSKFSSKRIKVINYMEPLEFKSLLSRASVVITHGGVGTILDALKSNKVIIAIPRLKRYKEHANDHQLQIINKFSNMGYIIPCRDISKLEMCLEDAKIFRPKKYKSNTEHFVELIEDYIDNN